MFWNIRKDRVVRILRTHAFHAKGYEVCSGIYTETKKLLLIRSYQEVIGIYKLNVLFF